MDLILWRHADANEAQDVDDDLQRELTAKGRRNAQRMADWLNRLLPDSTRVLASPALRAQQTAEALGRRFKTVDALRPDGSVEGLLAAARWPEARGPVLVVGHQPTLGLTAAYLMTGLPGGPDAATVPSPVWSIKKGAVWWLHHRPREGRAEVVLVAVRTPEQV